jgi:cardiolipin synthase
MQVRELFRKGQVLTIPNLLTMLRIVLLPFIIWSYVGLHNLPLTIVLLAVSALSDVLDGAIARKFNMVTDLGKALDPVADKLTQVSLVLCLAFTHPLMWYLLAFCVVRETVMLILGLITMKRTNGVFSAKWYGKVSTAMLYATGLALLIFPKMPAWLSTLLIVLCMICVLLALVLYVRFHFGLWRRAAQKKDL